MTSFGQCDACPAGITLQNPALNPHTPNVPLKKSPPLLLQRVNADYHALLSPFTANFSLLNQPALSFLNFFQTPQLPTQFPTAWIENWGDSTLATLQAQMVTAGLLRAATETSPPVTETAETLTVWLHLTERCNLHCTYCYLPPGAVDMSEATALTAMQTAFRTARTHGYSRIQFKYAGGEPLLQFKLIQRLHPFAQQLADQYQIALDTLLLTNGTLLSREMLAFLKAQSIRLVISYDELETTNPPQRPDVDGQPTAARVQRAIGLAQAQGVRPGIAITITARNVRQLPTFVAWLLKQNLPFSFNFYRRPDRCQATAALSLTEAMCSDLLATYETIAANLPDFCLLAALADRANFATPHLRTCGVGHSYLVIAPDGQIAKCQMQLARPITSVAAHDPLQEIRDDKTGIQNLTVTEKAACAGCRWKYWCSGGCPLAAFQSTGRYDAPTPDCKLNSRLYPEILRLEGLRLLKYILN
ncbi:SPASM domain-containing protein [candidate division KSB1 bacterium]|nr:SPASM domain-containing protein [candidate division KSB1 bacterium]